LPNNPDIPSVKVLALFFSQLNKKRHLHQVVEHIVISYLCDYIYYVCTFYYWKLLIECSSRNSGFKG